MMFFQNLCMMMSRVKPQHVSSIPYKSERENQGSKAIRCLTDFSILCSASAFGVSVVVGQISKDLPPSVILPSLIFAVIVSILAGQCQAECLTSQTQDVRSLYSRFYQNTSEIFAYIIGWTCLLSLSANVGLIARVLSFYVDSSLDYKLSNFLRDNLSTSCPDVLSVILTVSVLLLSLTGLSWTSWWFVISMPFVYLLLASAIVISYVYTAKENWSFFESIRLPDLGELLSGAALCSAIFTNSSIVRIPANHVHRRVSRTLGLYNILCAINVSSFAILLVFNRTSTVQSKIFTFQDLLETSSNSSLQCVIAVLAISSLCLLAVEFSHHTLTLMDDMASDGLLFRSLSKKSKSCGLKATPFSANLLAAIFIGTLEVTLSVADILKAAAVAPLFINTIVSVYVILQRYHDQDSWQYEPMLQNAVEASRGRNRSRSTSTEFLSRASLVESNVQPGSYNGIETDSEDSSETDIDAVFQEYKNQVHINGLNNLESPTPVVTAKEPTPSTSFRAKWFVAGLLTNYLVIAVVVDVEIRTKCVGHAAVLVISVTGLLLSVILLSLLQRLPQNSLLPRFTNRPQSRVKMVPWIPGFTAFFSLCLLIHLVPDVWRTLLVWTAIGFFLYLTYGVRNSTAASSFYAISSTAQLTLQPLPNYQMHRTQIIPAQRRPRNKRIQANQ